MTPPNPLLQSPSQRPVPPKPGRRASSDDLTSVKAVDEAEARARAAMALMNDEHEARIEAEKHAKELEEKLKELNKAPPASVTVVEDKATHSGSNHVQVVFSNRRFVIPFAVIIAVVPPTWSAVRYVADLLQQVKSLNTTVAGYQKSQELINQRLDKVVEDNAAIRDTQARLSGYLAGALPMAGVSVPGAEPGAIQVNIARDPDPVGTKKKPKVVTHTYVPAPTPEH